MKQFSVILIGAGNRGTTYCSYMNNMPDKYKIVGIAEPDSFRRMEAAKNWNVPSENCFADWREILSRPKFADIAVIATMDDMHYAPAMKAIELGYDLLLEKPVAPTAEECTDIANAAKKKGVSVLVCHVLRYAPFFKKIKSIVESGTIGEIMSIAHTEGIGDIHFTHSYVRGHWHSEKETSPMILAKACHDLDIVQWLIDRPCKKVSSFGELTYFTEKNAPIGAPVRCADGTCPNKDTCTYNCHTIYVAPEGRMTTFWKGFYRDIVKTHPDFTDEEVMETLRHNDYGLCVFHANNDVVDHQVVNLEFEGGANASITVNAFNGGGRYIRIFGTNGELFAHMSDKEIYVRTFEPRGREMVSVAETEESIAGGHGGGDLGIVCDLYDYLCGTYNGSSIADINTSVANHLIGFAAEKARHTDTIVSFDKFSEEFDFKKE